MSKTKFLARLLNVRITSLGDRGFLIRFGWPWSEHLVELVFQKLLKEFAAVPEIKLVRSGKVIRGNFNI